MSKEEQTSNNSFNQILLERKEFDFPPFVRLIKIIVKNKDVEKLNNICQQITELQINCKELSGPFTPQIDRIRGEYIKCFYIKLSRDSKLISNKQELLSKINSLKSKSIILDVDPL